MHLGKKLSLLFFFLSTISPTHTTEFSEIEHAQSREREAFKTERRQASTSVKSLQTLNQNNVKKEPKFSKHLEDGHT